jgi:hypothetical protein
MGFLRSSQLPSSLEFHGLTRYITASPMLFVPTIFVIICLITRIITEIQKRISQNQVDVVTKTPSQVPYWVPFVGSAISFVKDIEGTIARDR